VKKRKLKRAKKVSRKEFLLTPEQENKLRGRHMELFCCAPKCLFSTGETEDKFFERNITTHGYGLCRKCKHKTDIVFFERPEEVAVKLSKLRYRPKRLLVIPKCEVCGCKRLKIVYTQWVVSNHRKSKHYYYHRECFDSMFINARAEEPDKLFKKQKYKMRYAGSHGNGCIIYLPFDPRKGVCEACGKSKAKGEIKMTSLHHWKYAYKAETVKKNPILVLENTTELCFACHQVADGLRGIMKMSPERALLVIKLLPKDLKATFAIISNEYLKMRKEE
jgi:hypothetical protein